jgi:hypothetical protein
MVNLGVLYENGQGVAQDYAKAREWYEKSTAKDDARGMVGLASLYESGHGVTQDYVKAREWYEKSAAKGEARAMYELGDLYENGYGVTQDYAKAREWFEKAAAKGEALAMAALAISYATGEGGTQDYAKAREWYEKLAAQGERVSPDTRAIAEAELERLSANEAFLTGRYAEALQQEEVYAAKFEALQRKREGKPGAATVEILGTLAWYAFLAKDFTKALTVADRAHELLPDSLSIEINRAHALMFMGRLDEAKALYLAHKGERVSDQDNKLWERVVGEDYAELRKADVMHPMMADIEKELGISR